MNGNGGTATPVISDPDNGYVRPDKLVSAPITFASLRFLYHVITRRQHVAYLLCVILLGIDLNVIVKQRK
ncbi:hypothetical protein J6590_061195 [Homalodisca vitripennis]|nr:hypothetical protein J6590_061195 [Homalodisca vitripennis]